MTTTRREDVRRARLNKGKTQQEMADRVGCSLGTWNRLENGHLTPSVKIRAAIFYELGLSPFSLEEIKRADYE